MADLDTLLDTYAAVILKVGVNLQPGQTLSIGAPGAGAPIETADFVRRVAAQAYAAGAGDVVVEWADPQLQRVRLLSAPESALEDVPAWKVQGTQALMDRNAAFLNLFAPSPDLMADVPPERVARMQTAFARAYHGFTDAMGRLRYTWSIAAVATPTWARKVFPDLPVDEAVARLWQCIFRGMRVEAPDPVQAWRDHLAQLDTHADFMNRSHFARLHYVAPGTALTIDLPERHVWVSAAHAVNAAGTSFVPNTPTEEIFTLPQRDGVNGVLRSTMPLNLNGVMVRNLRLTLERGRIVDFGADEGYEAIKHIIETDDGSHYLGEVALVPVGSPVDFGFPLFNTLFDENASCHVAIGKALPVCLEGGEQMSPEELAAAGANDSLTHIDFMVGSPQLHIDGETASGERVPVFRNGTWANS
jgi:aminopeptidase